MRFATCNVRHGRPAWRQRPDHPQLVASVGGLGADVVGVQELDRGTRRSAGVDQPALLAAGTGLAVRFAPAIDHDGGQYGVMLGVRGRIGASEVLRLPGGGEARVALVAEVHPTAADRPWTVGCTHLSTRTQDAPGQLRLVLDELDRAAGDGPAVLLGDLNMGPDTVLGLLADSGWVDAPSGPTHPSTVPRRRIDWIIVRRASVRATIVPDVRVSDHRPLVALVDAEPPGSVP